MSPTPMSPVDYQPVMGTPGSSPPPPVLPPSPGRRSLDPKRSSRDRMMIMALGVGVCLVVWLLVILLFPPITNLSIQPTTPLWMSVIAALVWVGFTILTTADEPFFPRLAFIGAVCAASWGIITAILMLLNVTPLLSGWLAVGLLWLVVQGMPIWVIEIEPGEVLYFRPIYHRPYKYQLWSCPIQRIDPALHPTDRTVAPPFGAVASIFKLMDSASAHEFSQIELALDYMWVRPVDELRLLWKMEKPIVVESQIPDIVTRDQSTFTLWMKVAATLNPTKIAGHNFLLMLPKIESPAKLEAIMKGIITNSVDKAAREYFIHRSAVEARGEAGVMGFRNELATLLQGLSGGLGLTFDQSMINSTPIVSDEQRATADRAAAATDATRADLSTTKALIELAMSGSAPHRLLLYTRLIERGWGQYHVLPQAEQMPPDNEIEQFMWRVSRGDPDALNLLRSLMISYPNMPAPPSLLSYAPPAIPPSAPGVFAAPSFQPSAQQQPTVPSSSQSPPQAESTSTNELPLPAPARLRPPESGDEAEDNSRRVFPTPPDTMPPEPPEPTQPPTLPESSTPPRRPPAGGLRPNIDIHGALNTRQRPDGAYEVDLDNDDEDL